MRLETLVEAQALICRQYSSALRELRAGLITQKEFDDYHQMLRNRARGYRNDEEKPELAFGSPTTRVRAYLPQEVARGLQSSIAARHTVTVSTPEMEDLMASELPLPLARSLMGQRRGKA